MNLNAQMMPGITVLLLGAVMGLGAQSLCRNKKNVPQMRALGTALAFAGAILVFIP